MRFGFFDQLPCAVGYAERQRYQDLIAQIGLGDALGFDTVWLGELHFSRAFSILADPLMVLAAAASSIVPWPLIASAVLLGTFVALENIISRRVGRKTIGFGSQTGSVGEHDKELGDLLNQVTSDDILEFGMIPEFVGRVRDGHERDTGVAEDIRHQRRIAGTFVPEAEIHSDDDAAHPEIADERFSQKMHRLLRGDALVERHEEALVKTGSSDEIDPFLGRTDERRFLAGT